MRARTFPLIASSLNPKATIIPPRDRFFDSVAAKLSTAVILTESDCLMDKGSFNLENPSIPIAMSLVVAGFPSNLFRTHS